MAEATPKIYLFYCSNSEGASRLVRPYAGEGRVKAVPVPCSGKIDILYIAKAFETGAEGVAVLTCPKGECRYLEGNLRAEKRMKSISALVEEAGLGKGRAVAIQVRKDNIEEASRDLKQFCTRLGGVRAG
jgi:coenzyme F420-reducing hydrogenase delta subunit